MDIESFPLYDIEGDARQCGQQYGRAAGDRIDLSLRTSRAAFERVGLSWDRTRALARRFMIGLILGHLLSGIAVLETVFTLPGLGRLMIDSIFARDYPVLQGCLLFTACIYVVINLIVDMCYPLFDPRVSVQ